MEEFVSQLIASGPTGIICAAECITAFIGFVGAGSTVASGDVFPPTNNLDPFATYYLGWNANNGGLQWFSQGGN